MNEGIVRYELLYKYKIQNIDLNEDSLSLMALCEALNFGYQCEIINYRSYIDYRMNLRMLLELRKNAILPVDEELSWFYFNHRYCKTVEDIKKMRIDLLKSICSDYQDLGWQYYYLVLYCYGGKARDFQPDLEICCADTTRFYQDTYETYKHDFLEAHLTGYSGDSKWVDKDKKSQ